jgi:hypothetical protein
MVLDALKQFILCFAVKHLGSSAWRAAVSFDQVFDELFLVHTVGIEQPGKHCQEGS